MPDSLYFRTVSFLGRRSLASRDKLNKASLERIKWQALGAGVSKLTMLRDTDGTTRTFEPLSAVPEELCSIIKDENKNEYCATKTAQFGVISGKILPDDEFTLQTFKNNLGRYSIVHIASHFSLNTGNENDSYLLLGGGEERRLTLADVREGGAKFTGVELLTLSACNTAMSSGSQSNGVEIEGFGVLAQKQGANSVLATLWAVADESTRDLMMEFYRTLHADAKTGKAEALRGAQLSLLKGKYKPAANQSERNTDIVSLVDDKGKSTEFKRDPNAPYAHPYFWSSFILFGNWR